MSEEAAPGDFVKIKTKEETIKGTLLPRSELFDKRSGDPMKILKLENGYNIGISTSRIIEIEVVKKHKQKTSRKAKRTSKNDLPKVLVISCGGTISSRVDYITGGVHANYTAEDFIDMVPELENVASIDAAHLLSKMSEDLVYDDWKSMAKLIVKEYGKYDGFVVTQGTDTMHYSSAALSFFLEGLSKPVVFTAAQRSIDRGSTDAFMNLLSAVKFAGHSSVPGVHVCMHGTINDDFCLVHKGTKVRKMHSLRRDAFRSINDTPIAKVHYPGLEIEHMSPQPKQDEFASKIELKDAFEEKVALIHFYPNLDPGIVDYYLEKGYKGFVFAGTALGNICMEGRNSFEKVIARLKKKGLPVVMTSQCLYGRVDPLVYSTLRRLSVDGGVIFAEDMLPEVAYIKLSWLLGQGLKKEEIREKVVTCLRGEINHVVREDQFLN